MSRRRRRWSSRAGGGLAATLVWTLVVVVPLLVAPRGVDAFALPKRITAEALGLASLLALVALTRGRSARDLLGAARRSPAVVATAPLALVAALGLAVSPHPLHVRPALTSFAIGAACLVGWSLGLERRQLSRALHLLALPATVLAVLALFQATGLYQPFELDPGTAGTRLAVTSLAGNSGDLAAFLVLPCLVGLGAVRRGDHRVMWGLGVALWFAAMLATRSFGPVSALVVGAAVWALIALPRRITVAGLAVVALIGVAAAMWGPLAGRVAEKSAAIRSGDLDTVLTGRLDSWRVAGFLWREHPLTGVGLGAYRAEFAPAKLALIASGTAFYEGHRYPTFGHAHNEILEIGAELGWPGGVALVWGLGVLGVALRRGRYGGESEERALVAGLAASILVLSLGLFPFRGALTAYPFLVVLALGLKGAEGEADV